MPPKRSFHRLRFGGIGIGPIAVMRSINMNVILSIDYNRYAVSIEDAAKVMAILGKARSVSSRYKDDESYFQYEQTGPRVAIEQIDRAIRDAE